MGRQDHSGCADVLKAGMQQMDVEVVVSSARPLVESNWTEVFTCPHGTTFYMEPTTDQRAKWVRDGVR